VNDRRRLAIVVERRRMRCAEHPRTASMATLRG
jgi:hypothetical protein